MPPLPDLPFTSAPYDRRAERRADPGWWGRLAADPRARVLVVGDDVVATANERLRLLEPVEAEDLLTRAHATGTDDDVSGTGDPGGPGGTGDPGGPGRTERLLLGDAEPGPVAAVSLPQLPDRLEPRPVRQVAPGLDALQGSLLVHALGLANWHRTHPYCARCGAPSQAALGGHVRHCPSCGHQHFPRTDPAVIMLVTDDRDRALLAHSPAWPRGRFSTLAGFVEPGESLEGAVRREVAEETGVVVGDVTYAASQPWPFPSSLMLGFNARAKTTDIDVDGAEVSTAAWFSRHDLERAVRSGDLLLPGEFSISRWLVTRWYGGALPGRW